MCGGFFRSPLYFRRIAGVEGTLVGRYESDIGRLPNTEDQRVSPGCQLRCRLLDRDDWRSPRAFDLRRFPPQCKFKIE